MKKIIVFLFVIQITQLFSQIDTNNKKDYSEFFPQNNTNWLLDSTKYHVTWSDLEDKWYIQNNYFVQERTEQGFPKYIEYYQTYFHQFDNDLYRTLTFDYPNETDTNIYFIEREDYNSSGELSKRLKYYYNYDDNGYKIYSYEYWNGAEWGYGEKESIGYFDNDSSIHQLNYYKNELNEWELREDQSEYYSNKYTKINIKQHITNGIYDSVFKQFTYFNNGRKDSLSISFNKKHGEWIKFTKNEYKYDGLNRLVFQKEMRSGVSNIWSDYEKWEWEYDQWGYITSERKYLKVDVWRHKKRTDYVNNEQGNILELINYEERNDTNWIIKHHNYYNYNSYNQVTELIRYSKPSDYDSLLLFLKFNYEYKDSLLICEKLSTWNSQTDEWIKCSEKHYEYDDDKLILEIYYNIDSNDVLIPSSKREYNYFENNSSKSYSLKSFTYAVEEDFWRNQKEEYKYWNNYFNHTNELPINTFELYPNPASDFIVVKSNIYKSQRIVFEIINSSGKRIKAGRVAPSGNIDISELRQGTYILILKINGSLYSSKFIKQ